MALESATVSNVSPEYGDLMLEITGRMAGMGGVMAGMRLAKLAFCAGVSGQTGY